MTQNSPANPTEQNTEPRIIPSQNVTTSNTIIVANNRAASPVVIDAQNNATYMGPNATTLRLEMNRIFTRVVYGQKGQITPGLPPDHIIQRQVCKQRNV